MYFKSQGDNESKKRWTPPRTQEAVPNYKYIINCLKTVHGGFRIEMKDNPVWNTVNSKQIAALRQSKINFVVKRILSASYSFVRAKNQTHYSVLYHKDNAFFSQLCST